MTDEAIDKARDEALKARAEAIDKADKDYFEALDIAFKARAEAVDKANKDAEALKGE